MSDRFILSLWTADAAVAARADDAGVDRIGIDLDHLGKAERQAGLGTWISPHVPADLRRLRPAVRRAALFARTNPLHDGSAEEIDLALDAGARVLMLPMFRSAGEVAQFTALVAGRARIVGLLETAEALADVDAIARVRGLHEIHVGINDLALSLGLPNRFAVLVDAGLERVAAAVRAAGLRFGVGGIGTLGAVQLPIPPDLVYAQYARLGARAALLSRSYVNGGDLAADVRSSRARLDWWTRRPAADLARAADALREAIAACDSF